MDGSEAGSHKKMPLGLDATTEAEYASQSKLLKEFTSISSIDKAWIFKSDSKVASQGMFVINQPDLVANKWRKFVLSCNIFQETNSLVKFQWSPFPIEMSGVSTVVPSLSGSKLLVIRNPKDESPSHFEIWSPSQIEKEFHIPQSVHGSVYTDGRNGCFEDKDCGRWKGQGDMEENWGETYAGRWQTALFVKVLNYGCSYYSYCGCRYCESKIAYCDAAIVKIFLVHTNCNKNAYNGY